jgi:hypothetical protein
MNGLVAITVSLRLWFVIRPLSAPHNTWNLKSKHCAREDGWEVGKEITVTEKMKVNVGSS